MNLNPNQLRRYARNILLEDVGRSGQMKLLDSRVLVIGAGGLGSASLQYLAAAGVGFIGIIDDDRVELSNLQRQTIHETGDIGRAKVMSARDRIYEINPDVRVETYGERFEHKNAMELLDAYDIIIDGSDNFETRLLVADACYFAKKPLISAAIKGFEGQISTYKAYMGDNHPCYRCLVPDDPGCINNCADNGVIGAVAGIMGSMQALEAIKEILAIGESLSGHLLIYNALTNNTRKVALAKDAECKLCSKKPLIKSFPKAEVA